MPSHRHSHPLYPPSGSRSKHRHSEFMSNPAFSNYQGDKMLHFYRWTSPPGVMKILCIIIIILCVAIFACVASTLAWDYDMGIMGGGTGMIPGIGGGSYGYGGGSSGAFGGASYSGGYGNSYAGSGLGGSGSGYGYGYGGTQIDPKSGKGFIIAIAAITFIAMLIIFILVISRQNASRSSKFYLASIIICAILAFLMLISTIVYLVSVNPTAQSSGSLMYNQVLQLCAQYQTQTQAQGIFINQYLYHYCVVEPQEAIAIVLGFLVVVGLIIVLVFAVKTRKLIQRWGEDRILWEEVKVLNPGLRNSVGEWVTNVSGHPEVLDNDPNDRVGGSRDYLDKLEYNKPLYLPGDSDISSYVGGPKPKMEYDAGFESGDDLEEEDFSVLFPAIMDEHERLSYKKEFDRDHVEYKGLQAELEGINQDLADLQGDLDRHPEGSPKYLDALNEYTQLKNFKKSPDYQVKKRRCKYLKSKLSHIKTKISEYDRRP
ncbi:PREDICTED: occludin [Cyprinodon variegatus]|uniref:Occludin b n=1 Tax=Cyprinodon variegatus TaxID=28743 RepID=A0A3Q2D646_CYPVA|nr:PREDICTED: occludin [Cyprinodon variegatus]XP_015244358.1 PREDICTED: occludin [Cyprinodon variegatus]